MVLDFTRRFFWAMTCRLVDSDTNIASSTYSYLLSRKIWSLQHQADSWCYYYGNSTSGAGGSRGLLACSITTGGWAALRLQLASYWLRASSRRLHGALAWRAESMMRSERRKGKRSRAGLGCYHYHNWDGRNIILFILRLNFAIYITSKIKQYHKKNIRVDHHHIHNSWSKGVYVVNCSKHRR